MWGMEARIKELFNKHINKTISEEEFKELFEYLEQPEHKDDILNLMKQHELHVDDNELPDVDWDSMYRNIVQEELSATKRKRAWFYYVAASLLVIVGFYFVLGSNKDKSSVRTLVQVNDVPPGSSKALLTLADGSEISLSKNREGLLASQGTVKITKRTDGLVEYSSTDNSQINKFNTLTTPNGGTYSLELPDGTMVWLNAASSIKYPVSFGKKERRVEVSGEVYFEVAKDKTRPFYVKTGSAEIQVLGTHFNVMTYPDKFRSELTLLEGSVRFIKGKQQEMLSPGEQFQFVENADAIKRVQANIEEVMAWRNNLFVFNNTGIAEIMKDVARWYNVKIQYEGEIPDVSFTGIIPRNTNVSKVLNALTLTNDVVFGIKQDVIICRKVEK